MGFADINGMGDNPESYDLLTADEEAVLTEQFNQWFDSLIETASNAGDDNGDFEYKSVIRHVRTPEGERHFGLPIGAVIVADETAKPTFRYPSPDGKDWIRSRTVDVKATDLRKGDGVLIENGIDVHEVMLADHSGNMSHITTRNTRTGEVQDHTVAKSSIWKKVVLAISALAMLLGFAAGAVHAADSSHANEPDHHQTTSQVVHVPKHIDAPTTAAGYQKMWDQVSPKEWGGADVSISTALPDGRRLWLYGDTLSQNNGFVHSTAIVQDGGALHVSHGGQQLLPNGPSTGDRQTVYWIEKAVTQSDGTVKVYAAPMSIGHASPWDFKRADARSRVASVTVDAKGNANFDGWKGYEKAPDDSMINHGNADFKAVSPHHFTYQGFTHDIKLEDGKYLRTVSQNWDDDMSNHRNADGSLRFTDWRPIFEEGTTPGGPGSKAIIRHVRTPEGEQRYHLPIGSPIIADGAGNPIPINLPDPSKANPKIKYWEESWDGSRKSKFGKYQLSVTPTGSGTKHRWAVSIQYSGRRGTYQQDELVSGTSANELAAKKAAEKAAKQRMDEYQKRSPRQYDNLMDYWPGVAGYDYQIGDPSKEVSDAQRSRFENDPDYRANLATQYTNSMGIKVQDESSFPLDVNAHETINAVITAHDDMFPGFSKVIDSIGTESMAQYGYNAPNVLAYNGTDYSYENGDYVARSKLRFNYRQFGDHEDVYSMAARIGTMSDPHSDWHALDSEEFRKAYGQEFEDWQANMVYTTTHELGHTLGNIALGRMGRPSDTILSGNSMAFTEDMWNLFYEWGIINEDMPFEEFKQEFDRNIHNGGGGQADFIKFDRATVFEALSQYGSSSIHELMAESWAEYMLDPNPRDFSVAVGEMLSAYTQDYLSKLGEKKP